MTPRRANQPTLTREQIVAAAIAIVDRDGLGGLSMRKVAGELEMSPMALYYHVPDKSALYDLILDAVMSDVDLSACGSCETAEMRVLEGAGALRDALLRHPNAVPIALSRSLRTPGQLRPIEILLGALFEAGVEPGRAVAAADLIGHYVFGSVAAQANRMADSAFVDAARDEDLSAVTPEDFPNMLRALSEAEPLGPDAEFDIGLRVLVRGLLDR